jgi:hypothetical protein
VGEAGTAADNQVGYDAGKQWKGRKIHALVDTEGLPMRRGWRRSATHPELTFQRRNQASQFITVAAMRLRSG